MTNMSDVKKEYQFPAEGKVIRIPWNVLDEKDGPVSKDTKIFNIFVNVNGKDESFQSDNISLAYDALNRKISSEKEHVKREAQTLISELKIIDIRLEDIKNKFLHESGDSQRAFISEILINVEEQKAVTLRYLNQLRADYERDH